MDDFIYPAEEEFAYHDWTPPEHDCYFLDDPGVQIGRTDENGKMRVYIMRRCNQCDQVEFKKTNIQYNPPK